MAACAEEPTPTVTHFGTLILGDRSIDCAVLADGRRILSLRGLAGVLGRSNRRASDGGTQWPSYLKQKRLEPYLGGLLAVVPNSPFEITIPQHINGHHIRDNRAIAINAEVLPDILWAYVDADGDGALRDDQKRIAKNARQVLRAMSGVAIVALIDEATGYQLERRENELQTLLLERLVSPERHAWVRRYTNDFFVELYRIYEIPGDPLSHQRPGFVGMLINFIVYDRIALGLTAELQRLNDDRAAKHHQYLSEEGIDEWQDVMRIVMRIMRRSRERYEFEERLAAVLPRSAEQLRLRFQAVGNEEFSARKMG